MMRKRRGYRYPILKVCPVCMVTADKLVRAEDGTGEERLRTGRRRSPLKAGDTGNMQRLRRQNREVESYDPEYARTQTDARYMDEIHEMAVKGQSIIAAMGTQMPMPGWDDILFLGPS